MNKTIYLAGGCFWGMEHLMESIKGVVSTTVGYANGNSLEEANYKTVCLGNTRFRETVKVIYDSSIVSLDFILFAYFNVIHPEQKKQQGNDIGDQYQTGIYYIDEDSKKTIERIYNLEKSAQKEFYVEFKELENFYSAEEYHQKYLDKNPNGYCHISFSDINKITKIDASSFVYDKPSKEKIKELL